MLKFFTESLSSDLISQLSIYHFQTSAEIAPSDPSHVPQFFLIIPVVNSGDAGNTIARARQFRSSRVGARSCSCLCVVRNVAGNKLAAVRQQLQV